MVAASAVAAADHLHSIVNRMFNTNKLCNHVLLPRSMSAATLLPRATWQWPRLPDAKKVKKRTPKRRRAFSDSFDVRAKDLTFDWAWDQPATCITSWRTMREMREPKSNLLPLLFPNVFSLILYYSLFLVLSCQKLIYFPECLVNGFPSADVFLLPNRCQTSNGREWRRRLVRKLKGSKELFITRKWGEKEMRFKGNDSPPVVTRSLVLSDSVIH